MAGNFSRKIYDNCYNIEFIDQQVNPCKYRTLDEFAENNIKCNSLNGPRANKTRGTGELGNNNIVYRTDIESQLYNLDVPDSRCITLNTMKEKNQRLKKQVETMKINYSECNKGQDFIYSRLDIPVNEFRSIYINRYGYPIIDPKEFVYYGSNNTEQVGNQRFGVNTQIAEKDKILKPNMNPVSTLTK
jgi:hypothetical protein